MNVNFITIKELEKVELIDSVIIESLDQSIYRAEVNIQGETYYLKGHDNQPLARRNILSIQELLSECSVNRYWLKQSSAYDEMVGQAPCQNSNELLLPLGDNFKN